MNIRKRGSSYTVDFKTKNKRIRKDFKSIDAAVSYVNLIEKGSAIDSSSITLQQAADEVYELVWKDTSNGDNAYRNALLLANELGQGHTLKTIDQTTVDNLGMSLKNKGNSNSTINNKMSALMVILKKYKDRGVLRDIPNFKRYKISQGRLRFFSLQEENLIIDKHNELGQEKFGMFVQFLIDTGLRTGEATNLTWNDVREQNGRTVVDVWDTKNGEFRTVPLSQRCVHILSLYKSEDSCDTSVIFNYTKSNIRTYWNRVRDALGFKDDVEFVPHVCRHTCYAKLNPAQLFDALDVMETATV